MWKRLLQHVRDLIRRLFEIEASPHALAGGVAVGVFFGFTPLFGLKTMLSCGTALALRVNPVAALIAVCLHDVVTPFWPVLLRIEYDIGYWLLSHPHHLPPAISAEHFHPSEMLKWTTFLDVGRPLLLGSMFLAVPFALLFYGIVFRMVSLRKRRLVKPGDGG